MEIIRLVTNWEDIILPHQTEYFKEPDKLDVFRLLVKRGAKEAKERLPNFLESYLAQTLYTFMPEKVAGIEDDKQRMEEARKPEERLALLWNQAEQEENVVRKGMLFHELGQTGLLNAGLFPGQAERRMVNVKYFLGITDNAYRQISYLSLTRLSFSPSLKFVHSISHDVADNLGSLAKVLQYTRLQDKISPLGYKVEETNTIFN